MKNLFLIILVLTNLTLSAQQNATTDDGKVVILKSDGTWEYIKTDNSQLPTNGYDFRKTSWGISKDKVKQLEIGKLEKEEKDILAYSDKVASMDVIIIYIFVDDKLVRAKYSFFQIHTNDNEYISDFITINNTLTEKYGTPVSEKKYWSDDLYKDDYDKYGFAVSLGHLKYFSKWETTTTEITTALTGDNYKIKHVVEYVSKKYSGLEEQKLKDKKNSEF